MLKTMKKLSPSQMRLLSLRFYTQQNAGGNQPNETPQPAINPNVPGLSENCVAVPNKPVGPSAAKDKEYKNPEYFCYHMNSFAEAEVEMAKFRLPAPSNKQPFTPVGPSAAKDKEYKNPEYFCYHMNSFAEAEVEMAKFRLPAPSNKQPFTRNL